MKGMQCGDLSSMIAGRGGVEVVADVAGSAEVEDDILLD